MENNSITNKLAELQLNMQDSFAKMQEAFNDFCETIRDMFKKPELPEGQPVLAHLLEEFGEWMKPKTAQDLCGIKSHLSIAALEKLGFEVNRSASTRGGLVSTRSVADRIMPGKDAEVREKMKKTITRTHIPGMCSLNTAAKHSGIPRKDLTKAAKDLNMRLTERNENIFITTAQMDALRNHIQTQTGRFF